ncbi:hypothetical protein ABPG75_013483 [Micractinium tetrahymenae]
MQTEAVPVGATSPGWKTVGGRRRRRQGGDTAAPLFAATASDGEQHSDGGSSAGIGEPEEAPGAGLERILSTSLLSPRQQLGFMAELAADAAEGTSSDPAAAPLSPPRSPLHNLLQQRQEQQQQQQQQQHYRHQQQQQHALSPRQRALLPSEPNPPAMGSLGRQDSQSALSLADLARASGLRSSKSEAATLSARSARSAARQRHSAQDGDPASSIDGGAESLPLERVVESAGAVHGPSQPRRSGPEPAPASAGAAPGTSAAAGSAHAAQPFSAYLAAELHPAPIYPTADLAWGQTERDRVYNALVSVPFQLERFLLFGVAICLDSFLAIFTLLPLRVGLALLAVWRSLVGAPESTSSSNSGAGGPLAAEQQSDGAKGSLPANPSRRGSTDHHHQQHEPPPAPQQPQQGNERHQGQRRARLRGDQLFDLLCAGMSLGVVLFLWNLNAGTLYFWMKDLTQELLKLSVLYTALELSDKICCSFGVDVLEALAASCTQLAAGWSRGAAFALATDVVVASLLLALHGATLMSQAMVFGVAMNSKKNTLVALLIAANFTEIKGTVLKRFDTSKLFSLACQDVVERFHLLLILAFVIVEEMGNSGARSPNPRLLAGCAHIYAGEVVIDIIKHAVLGKFNEIRPGVYREYMRDLCDRVASAQSHNIHKLVGFEPFAPAALAFRITATAAALRAGSSGGSSGGVQPLAVAAAAARLVAAWLLLLAAKVGLGFLLKLIATAYLRHYEVKRGARHARRSVVLQHAPAVGTSKKEE